MCSCIFGALLHDISRKKGDINGEKGFNSLIFVGWRVFVTAHDMDGREMGGNEIRAGIFPVEISHPPNLK
jgi:hypothetical protein